MGIATQLITVGATLSGVVLTLVVNAHLEGRGARDAREMESLRLASERAKWLRDEHLKAYAGLSLAAEEVLQFIRSELPNLLALDGVGQRNAMEIHWLELRTQLRKAYNQVALFGATDARIIALQVWRIARNGGNDFFRDYASRSDTETNRADLSEQLRDGASRLDRRRSVFGCLSDGPAG